MGKNPWAVVDMQEITVFFFCLPWKSPRLKGRNVATHHSRHWRAEVFDARVVALDWYRTVFDLIDLRSFSNLWYWIALAVLWSTTSHWILGVPFDMVTRARKYGGQTAEDLHLLVGINTRRLLFIARVSGLWLIGLMAFFFSVLVVLGFVYRVEFAQAVFLLMVPMVIVSGLSLLTAQDITLSELQGEALYRKLARHRMIVQAIGMVSIFITSLWGMWQNMQVFNLWPN